MVLSENGPLQAAELVPNTLLSIVDLEGLEVAGIRGLVRKRVFRPSEPQRLTL